MTHLALQLRSLLIFPAQASARRLAFWSFVCRVSCCSCQDPSQSDFTSASFSVMFHFSYGGSLVYDGSLSGGGFVAFCFVAAQVTMAAAAVPLLVAGTRRAAAAARRAVDLLQRQPRLPHRGGPILLLPTTAIIESKFYAIVTACICAPLAAQEQAPASSKVLQASRSMLPVTLLLLNTESSRASAKVRRQRPCSHHRQPRRG